MTERVRAAIYVRISRDKERDTKDAGLGVDRQQEDCRALAERLGWEVVAVYADNDISAFSGKARPQYRAMLAAVKAGQIGAILAWHPDRLYRRAVDLEEIVTIAETNHLQIATATAGDVNLSTPGGRMNARIIASVAQGEVENTRSRVRSAKEQAAKAGKYRGGRRPFGYGVDTGERRKGKIVWDMNKVNEKEAEHLRHAVKALRAGRSLNAVVRDLNEMGSQTSTGKPWDAHTLRPVLLRARNAGLIQHGPVWHREPDIEENVKAEWDAILDEEEWRAVHKLLTNPARRTAGAGASEPKWLLSGIATCGKTDEDGTVCGATMRASGVGETESRPNHKRTYHYKCSEKNHLTANQEHVDKHVREEVAKIVRDPRIVRLMTAGEHDGMQVDRERRALLVKRLEQTEADYDEDLIDARTRKRKVEKIEAELNEVEERLAAGVQQAVVLPIFSSVDPGQAFLDAPLDIQRAVLRAVLRVEVLPATAPRRVWKDDRLRLSPVA